MTDEINMSLEEFQQRERAASLMADELATLRAENERLKAAIPNTKLRDVECKTLEDWRKAAMYYESNWSRCSYDFNSVAGELKDQITERTRQLDEYKQDALRWLFYASSPQTALSLGAKLDPLTEQDWKAECDRLADAAISGAN